jgi:hypothetical protein
MTADTVSRRAFLSFRLGGPHADPAETTTPDLVDDPFASYAVACGLVNEARPFLADEARRYGISTEDRSDLDILKDIYAKAALPNG